MKNISKKSAQTATQPKRKVFRSLIGTVVSDRMEKTIVVEVTLVKTNALYRKQYMERKRYKVHDPHGDYHVGDVVEIVPMRPMSREKQWSVLKKVDSTS